MESEVPPDREGSDSVPPSLVAPPSSRSETLVVAPADTFDDPPQDTPALLSPNTMSPLTWSTMPITSASPSSPATDSDERVGTPSTLRARAAVSAR